MEENKLNFTKEEQNIITKYKKIQKFIFKYSIFIIIGLIAIFIFSHQITKTQTLDITDDFVVEKAKLIGNFNKLINQNTNDKDLQIHILQGELKATDDLIFSNDNLIAYKNIIMPNIIFAHDLDRIKSKKYFDNKDYDITNLKNFATSILFTNSQQETKSAHKAVALPLNENIENTFYLKCTKESKIINKVCDNYIENFLDTFFVYNIQEDYDGLLTIFNNLKNTKYKNKMCNEMNKYILYSNNTDEKLENIFISCGQSFYQKFHTLQIFLEIQNQLQKGYITTNIYQNNILNNYKLISYQQIIYNDIHQNIVNNIRFDTYINYIQQLLKKGNAIDNFYIDLTYWLNNNYIIPALNKLKYNVSDKQRSQIETILDNINKLNNGDKLIGYNGLKDILTNKELENNILSNEIQIDPEQQNTINKLLSSIKEFSFFKVISDKILANKIKINGYFIIKTKENNIIIYTSLIVKNINDDLILQSIKLEGHDELNNIINNLLKNKQYTISQIHQYIQENLEILSSNNQMSTCELIENNLDNLLQSNNNIIELNLLECSPNKINIIKKQRENKIISSTHYKLDLDNFDIQKVAISDKKLENEISNYIDNIKTNNITISSIIKKILDYKIETKQYIQQGSNNIIITLENFESYLGITPDDIIEGNDQIIAEFTIQGIKFIGQYDINSKKLGPLYFKNNISISNFELYLTQDNQNKLNEFLINPIEYIKKINPTAILKYINSKED